MDNNKKLSYTKLESVLTPKLITKQTNEQRFWQKYQQNQIQSPSQGMINAIASNSNDLGLIIFGQGRSVNVIEPSKHSIVKSLSHF